MNAVNLLPESARRSATGTASYVVLGLLGLVLLLVTVATVTDRQVADKRDGLILEEQARAEVLPAAE